MTESSRTPIDIRILEPRRVDILAAIDRSEEIALGYSVEHGELVERARHWSVPPWDATGDGQHSVARLVEWLHPIVDAGATVVGAFDNDNPVGIAVVQATFENDLGWLAALHVSRPYRHRGVASALWKECAQIAASAGAKSMYVSATPSGSAVGFYLSRGCGLARPPNPELFALEPEDIHLMCPIWP